MKYRIKTYEGVPTDSNLRSDEVMAILPRSIMVGDRGFVTIEPMDQSEQPSELTKPKEESFSQAITFIFGFAMGVGGGAVIGVVMAIPYVLANMCPTV